jgi:hypothetical protein
LSPGASPGRNRVSMRAWDGRTPERRCRARPSGAIMKARQIRERPAWQHHPD